MRATFITTTLENRTTLDVQYAAGHGEPSMRKLYDRTSYNPEKSASFCATYRQILSSEVKQGSGAKGKSSDRGAFPSAPCNSAQGKVKARVIHKVNPRLKKIAC